MTHSNDHTKLRTYLGGADVVEGDEGEAAEGAIALLEHLRHKRLTSVMAAPDISSFRLCIVSSQSRLYNAFASRSPERYRPPRQCQRSKLY